MDVKGLMSALKREGINLHSALITVNGETVYEMYVPPFTADMPHRMYSQTKTFVSMAIGCLIDEGKLKLDDRIVSFFLDKLPATVSREMSEQTVRNMLMMNTCLAGVDWFRPEVTDRLKCYFEQTPVRPAGTLFNYDSTGSYVLGCLVERLSGMKLLDYMKVKFLNELGGFENTQILETMDGTPWGDSGMLATTRGLERMGRLLMQKGEWSGKQLISRAYVEAAVSNLTDTSVDGYPGYDKYGYGYQVWRTQNDGFCLLGMGGQHTIIIPEKRIVFACTGDNQFNPFYGETLHRLVFEYLDPRPQAEEEYSALPVAAGKAHSEFENEINGAWFACKENEMGIKRFRLIFEGDAGRLEYENAQGSKTLPFGMNKNDFGLFPQLGYSDACGNEHKLTDFRYKDAVSAGWVEPKKLRIWVQVIDRYLGSCVMNFGFRDKDTCGIKMVKSAEDFFREYSGWGCAYRI